MRKTLLNDVSDTEGKTIAEVFGENDCYLALAFDDDSLLIIEAMADDNYAYWHIVGKYGLGFVPLDFQFEIGLIDDAEYDERKALAARHAEEIERAEYDRLKAKFGDDA